MSEACGNPVCSNLIGPKEGNWRRTPRKYCSDRCKMDGWAIKHARDLLAPLPEDRRREILATGRNMADERCSHARAYRCRRYPQLAIGKRVRFSNGIFETNDSDLQRFVESNEWFGIYIERIDLSGADDRTQSQNAEKGWESMSGPFYRKANREQPEGRPLGTIGL